MGDRVLSRDEVEEFKRHLSLLGEPTMRDHYVQAHAKCCLARGKLPSPEEIQYVLNLWKVLWRWEQNSRRPDR